MEDSTTDSSLHPTTESMADKILPQVFVWDSRKNTVREGSGGMRGLTDSLCALFYPGYSYKHATQGPRTAGASETSRKKKAKKKTKRSGVILGKRLDREINEYHLKGSSPSLPQTQVLIQKLIEQGYRIVQCQLPVADPALRLCTCLDLLVWDGHRYIILEIKTGYGTYKFRHSERNMSTPLTEFHDSPNNQHFLQVLGGEMLFRQTYPTVPISSQLWYLSEESVEVNTVPAAMTKHVRNIRVSLEGTKAETKKDRRGIKRKCKSSATRQRTKRKQQQLEDKIERRIRMKIAREQTHSPPDIPH